MKKLLILIRSFFSIGYLGWIMLLMAFALLVGSLAAVTTFDSFDTAWQRIDALTVLEDQVSNHLREMELSELYYIFAMEYQTDTSDELEQAANHAAQINQIIDDLIAEGHFTSELYYAEEAMQMVEDFRSALEAHQASFTEVVSAYQAEDYETAQELMLTVDAENSELQAELKDITTYLDAERTQAVQQFPVDTVFAIQGVSIALILILLMALWGFRGITAITQPLINLTNAVIAAGGDQYRPELTTAERKLRNPAGSMARALDAFAKEIEQRDAAQKQEITELREKLYESRRSRLKISGPGR